MSDSQEKKPLNKFSSKMRANRPSSGFTMDQLLLGAAASSLESSTSNPDSDKRVKLTVDRFYPLKQVRTEIDDHSIYELAQTYHTHGQLQAIKVYPADSDGRHCIYNGERRWRAASLIPGFELEADIMTGKVLEAAERVRKEGGYALSGHGAPDTIPSSSDFEPDQQIPLDGSAKESRILLLSGLMIENDQREPLSVLDTARTLQELFTLCGSQEEVAKTVGWYINSSGKPNVNRVSRYLGILKLPPEGLDLVQSKVLQDLTIIELMRKISELDMATFQRYINLAKEGQIARSVLDAELKKLKDKNNHQANVKQQPQQPNKHAQTSDQRPQNPRENPKPASPKPSLDDGNQAHRSDLCVPTISFHVDGFGVCKLCPRKSDREGFALVEFESGEISEIPFPDLKIYSISYGD